MDNSSVQKLLQQRFPKSNKEDWKRIAISELNGNEPFKVLSWKDDDGLIFLPYYDHSDLQSLDYLHSFHFQPTKNSFLGNQTWYNLPGISVSDEVAGNQIALQHLNSGADGILFTIENNSQDLNRLLHEIKAPDCVLSFKGNFKDEFINSLASCFGKHNSQDASGCLFWDEIPHSRNLLPLFDFESFKSLGCSVTSSTPVKEIHDALVAGVKIISLLSENLETDILIRNIAFSIPLHSNFLSDISKLKALRLLWFQIAQAYGSKDYKPETLHIHGRSDSYHHPAYEPQENLLKSTSASMAGIFGGCDSLTITPQNENHPMMNRIARNVSVLLREESHLDKVSDPLAGSFAIENSVHEMAQKAWTDFQSTMNP